MNFDANALPNDVVTLKKIVVDKTKQEEYFKKEIRFLKEELKLIRNTIFGKKSEKFNESVQLNLFNEAEYDSENKDDKPDENDIINVKAHTKKRAGRKPISDDIPREIIEYDLSPEEKTCQCCGEELPNIGETSTEKLAIIPAKVFVRKHVRFKYGQCQCQSDMDIKPEIKIALMPEVILPKSMASPEILAYILTSKYCDGLPFYRQQNMLKRYGVNLQRATMSNWGIKLSSRLSDLMEIFVEEIIKGPFIQMDETYVQVLKETDRDPTSKSYIWVTVGYPAGKQLILYNYFPSRSGEIPKRLLKGFSGYFQTDGYAGYNEVVRENRLIHLGCFAHVRRKFTDILKVDKKSKSAKVALGHISNLYLIESNLRKKLKEKEISESEFEEKRRELVLKELKRFKKWLDTKSLTVLQGSLIYKAINYTLNEWEKLTCYLDKWFLTPDNNVVENAIRPFVIGRKNWLFFNTPQGAHSGCTFYSLIESAKANGLEPYKYLLHLFQNLPKAKNRDQLRQLLPTNIESL